MPRFNRFHAALLALVIALLSACAGRQTPEDVSSRFWNAVVNNDQKAIGKYVAKQSLPDPGLLSNKDKMLKSVEVQDATIEGDHARVPTVLIGERNGKQTRLPVTTFLVREDGQWKVDGQRSVNALVAASVNLMMNDISGNVAELGQALSNSISSGLEEFIGALNRQVPAIRKELSELSDQEKTREIGRKLGQLFSQGLGQALQELNKGLDDLSRELDKTAPPAPDHRHPRDHSV